MFVYNVNLRYISIFVPILVRMLYDIVNRSELSCASQSKPWKNKNRLAKLCVLKSGKHNKL